uniref:Phosducin thioredoxin-like domain-containing protein n=1 Tax=Zooxanthella nutricula TaxID=1333877 RepID=A0A7S2MVH3_9DINO
MVKQAEAAQNAQLCVQAGGGVKKADPHTAFAGGASQATNLEEDSYEADLRKAREARLAQLKEQQAWRQQGHGSLRELQDEAEFVRIIGPHDRVVVLLDDGREAAAEDVKRALDRLAKSHLEAQFCRLPVERAYFLTTMVQLEGLPAVFILRDGQVTRHLPPSRLFEFASASSPLFPGHLARLLHRTGALLSAEGASDSEGERSGEEDGEDREKPRGALGAWRRA